MTTQARSIEDRLTAVEVKLDLLDVHVNRRLDDLKWFIVYSQALMALVISVLVSLVTLVANGKIGLR